MAKSKPRKKQTRPVEVPEPPNRDELYMTVGLGVIAVLAILTFLPLMKYFFAQDDFILIYRAWAEPGSTLGEFFGSAPGQFRPLTKVAYFAVMYAIFGLNAAPYHIASILVHLVNAVLFLLLLRRLKIGVPAALITTQLFALHMAYFHVIAWISCIQQLAALTFVLAALVLGLDAVRGESKRARWWSLAAYVAGLMCVEQTFGVPILLVLAGVLGLGAPRRPLADVVRVVAPHLVVLVVYVVFMAVWKSPPDTGPYKTQFGTNVLLNITTYLGWMYEFWQLLPAVMVRTKYVLTSSHVILAVLLIYHLARRRASWVAFAFAFFFLTLAPALLLVSHTFYLHTYVASFGMLLLIAMLLDDAYAQLPKRWPWLRVAAILIPMLAGSFASFGKVRLNERSMINEARGFQTSFVLRRARIAETVYRDLMEKTENVETIKQVYMVYGRTEDPEKATWNVTNFRNAIGRGKMINLAYDKRELLIHFKIVGDTIGHYNGEISRLFVFGDFGQLLTGAEAGASIGADTTAVHD